MPVLALAGPIAGALGASTAAAGVIGAAGTLGAGLYAANKQKKDAAGGSAPYVDPATAARMATEQARSNAAEANALELQYNPELNRLRRAGGANLLDFVSQNLPYQAQVPGQGALTTEAQRQAMANLQSGGALPQDVVNQIARSAAARAGTVTGGGMGWLGRDINLRDLGMTSLSRYDQNLATAAGLGQQADVYGLNRYQLGQNVRQQGFSNALNVTQMANAFKQPTAGLAPESVANLYAGNINAQSQWEEEQRARAAAANSANSNLWGNAIGAVGGAIKGQDWSGLFKGSPAPAPVWNSFNTRGK